MLVNNIVRAAVTNPITEKQTLQLNERAKHHFAPVSVSIKYFNYLPFDITVVERTGFRHTVPCVAGENATQCDFIVRLVYNIKTSSVPELRRIINSMDVRTGDDLSIIKTTFLENVGTYDVVSYVGFEITLETRYKQHLFSSVSSDLYCNKRDIVLSSKNLQNASAHPHHGYSVFKGEMLTSQVEELNCDDYAVRIEIIDNFSQTGEKFGYSLGKVISITPKKDPTRLNGVYITTLERNGLSDSGCKISTNHYELEHASEKLKLYDSVKEAESGGDLAASRKLELENLSFHHTVLKREIEEANLKHKREIEDLEHSRKLEAMQWEQRIKNLERENEQLTIMRENEKNDRKDFFERSQQQRKETIDYFKFLPQVIITIGALYLAINKLSPPPAK